MVWSNRVVLIWFGQFYIDLLENVNKCGWILIFKILRWTISWQIYAITQQGFHFYMYEPTIGSRAALVEVYVWKAHKSLELRRLPLSWISQANRANKIIAYWRLSDTQSTVYRRCPFNEIVFTSIFIRYVCIHWGSFKTGGKLLNQYTV